MNSFLSDNRWDGIAGIVAIISLIITLFIERNNLLRLGKKTTKFSIFFLITYLILISFIFEYLLRLTSLKDSATYITLLFIMLNNPATILVVNEISKDKNIYLNNIMVISSVIWHPFLYIIYKIFMFIKL